MGIAEQNMMGIAAGLAAAGKVVFASSLLYLLSAGPEQVREFHRLFWPECQGFVLLIPGLRWARTAVPTAIEDIALMRCYRG